MKRQNTGELTDMVKKPYARGLGIYRISEELLRRGIRASPEIVRRMLKKSGVKLRPPNSRNKVPTPLKQQAIAITGEYDADTALEYLEDHGYPVHIKTIRRWLREKRRTYRPLPPNIEEIVKQATQTYLQEKIGAYRLAQRLRQQGIDIKPRTLLSYIKRHTTIRTNKESLHLAAKHQTKPFSGDGDEMYYLMGFRAGDLYVKPASDYRIRVSCSSSIPAFWKLFEELFGRYGHVKEYPTINRHKEGFVCYERVCFTFLERRSFDFMIPKTNRVPDEVGAHGLWYFAAGLTDAEGSINISRHSRRRNAVMVSVDISNSDGELLRDLQERLLQHGINSFIRKTKTSRGRPHYRVYVKRKRDVAILLQRLPIRHEDKRAMCDLALKILCERLRWPEAKPWLARLRHTIAARRVKGRNQILEELASRRILGGEQLPST